MILCLFCFKDDESIDKAIQESVFPRLVGCGNIAEVEPLYIAADGMHVAKLHGRNIGLPMTLILLIGTFYIFNVEYPVKARNIFMFLEAMLLDNSTEATKSVVIQKILKELN